MTKPAAGSLRGDARQQMHHREIGERRIAGNALREFEAFGEAFAFADQILRQPDRLAFLGGERAPGQHHVHHARGADQRRQPHRAAAADIDAAAGFRQRVERGALGDADMRRGGKFEAAADHRAVQHGDDRHRAELDALERAMPGARMLDAGEGVALGQFGQIEPGAEMIAFAGQHDGADIVRQRSEERSMPRTVGSSSALRLAARLSLSTATAPCRSAFRVGGRSRKFGWPRSSFAAI